MQLSDIQTLQFEPTSFCNAKCPHCPRFDVTRHDVFESTGTLHPDLTLSHIDIDSVSKNLQVDKLTSLQKIILEGDKGDPMMHPEIEKFIELFSSLPTKPLIHLITNGSIRNPEWWSNLAKKQYSNLLVTFSIDGLADTNHLYRVGIDFKKIMDNAKAFIDAGGQAIWKCIVFKHNEHQLDEIYRLSKDMGFFGCSFPLAHSDRFKGLDKWPVITDAGTHYLEVSTKRDRKVNINTIFKPLPGNRVLSPKPSRICPNLAVGQLYITHQNYIIPCCMMHFDTELKYFGTDQLRELTGEFGRHDISKFSLSTILEQPFFKNKLMDSFRSGNLLNICEKSCKKEIQNNLKYDISTGYETTKLVNNQLT